MLMVQHHLAAGSRWERLAPHLRGHAFLFEAKSPPVYDPSAGLRLLVIFLLLEGVFGPRLSVLSLLRLPLPPAWLRVPALLGLALVLVRVFARLELRQIGLYPWREWSRTEKSYFLQVLPVATVLFSLLFADRLRMIAADPSTWRRAAVVSLTYLVWGLHQEVLYRGVLQTELVRRWGSLPGIVVSNTLYTVGPLHFDHFSMDRPLPMFAAIFAIGLFFAVLFRRSGNLCMVGIFHGLGDCYFTGLASLGH
jgi:membrane protease YdiL (CAAX protease family)